MGVGVGGVDEGVREDGVGRGVTRGMGGRGGRGGGSEEVEGITPRGTRDITAMKGSLH